MNLTEELATACSLARAAGARIRAISDAASAHGGLAVETKADDSPVTEADHTANALIVSGLRARFPSDGLLSEEAPDDGSRLERPRVWMIDPLDGTKDFIRGRDGFAVMIGLCVDGRPTLGVVYQPRGDRLYYASRGAGAWLRHAAGEAERLHVSAVDDLASIRMVASQSNRSHAIDEVRERLGIRDELNIGSVGLKLGLISAGARDLYVNPSSKSKLWDTCGPEAILDEAGGRMTDLGGAPLDYRAADVACRNGLIASNGRVHERVVARLAELFHGRAADD